MSCLLIFMSVAKYSLLGALTELRKATTSSVGSGRLSVRMELFGPNWMNFRESLYLCICLKSVGRTKVSLKSVKNNGYFT
jgi:hypothetical protein